MRRLFAILLLALSAGFLGMPVGQIALASLAEPSDGNCCSQSGAVSTQAACAIQAEDSSPSEVYDPLSLCNTCSACHACHHVGLFDDAASTGLYLSQFPRLHPALSYRSAETTPSFKPPIS